MLQASSFLLAYKFDSTFEMKLLGSFSIHSHLSVHILSFNTHIPKNMHKFCDYLEGKTESGCLNVLTFVIWMRSSELSSCDNSVKAFWCRTVTLLHRPAKSNVSQPEALDLYGWRQSLWSRSCLCCLLGLKYPLLWRWLAKAALQPPCSCFDKPLNFLSYASRLEKISSEV